MSIPSQMPAIVVAARSGALQTLALQVGQVVDAKVVGPAPNGGTQVEIRGQMLNLALPLATKAGDALRLEVQANGPQLRLLLQTVRVTSGKPGASAPPSPTPDAQAPTAAVSTRGSAPATGSTPVQVGAGSSAPPTSSQMAVQVAVTATTTRPAAVSAQNSATPTTAAPVAPVSSQVAAYPQSKGNSNSSVPAQGTTSAPADTPRSALAQMANASLPRQAPVTELTAALTSIAGKVVLPEAVTKAAQQVLAGRVMIDSPKFDGGQLQAAVRGSGIFQEAGLAKGQLPLPSADLKSALLALRQTLTQWVGQQAPVAPASAVPPPLRGTTPRSRTPDTRAIDPASQPEEVGRQLLERTDWALSRVRLHQHASLPDPQGKTGDWSLDLPVLIGTQQALMQLQIHRDEHREGDGGAETGWQMRFALNLPTLGEVGAQVSLRGGTTGVMLWATDPAASQALEAEAMALRETLAAAGLKPGAVVVRHGAPPEPQPARSGHFIDAST
ncbi:flagellar hook-length control protein FliK [Devosia sp. 2618]|uniref:flagellar hook-length control protein FliK n=1 Tax=Devosia sp. 2618 TaxID=3156454 RepID=UPI00339775CF